MAKNEKDAAQAQAEREAEEAIANAKAEREKAMAAVEEKAKAIKAAMAKQAAANKRTTRPLSAEQRAKIQRDRLAIAARRGKPEQAAQAVRLNAQELDVPAELYAEMFADEIAEAGIG